MQAFYAQRYGMQASVDPTAGPVDGEFTARWLQVGPLHVVDYWHEPAIVLHAGLHSYGAGVALSGAFTLEQANTQVAWMAGGFRGRPAGCRERSVSRVERLNHGRGDPAALRHRPAVPRRPLPNGLILITVRPAW